jgi:modulator of FtsH protease
VTWDNFFVAEVGASAALLGLLFVAVSINLAKILQYPQLPGRAAESLGTLVAVLLVATCGLVPGQSTRAFGIELVSIGALAWLFPIVMQLQSPRQENARRYWMINRVVLTQLSSLPIVVAGATLLAGSGGGLYWLVPAVGFAYVNAVFGGWVLLVEINR